MPSLKNTKELRGLALPALKEQGGYFASKGKYDVAWGDVLVAVFTPIGGRPMQRNFGSSLQRVLFEPADEQLQTRIGYIISESLAEFCPHIRLQGVRVLVKSKVVEVSVTFSLVSDTQKLIGSVSIPRSGQLNAASSLRFAA